MDPILDPSPCCSPYLHLYITFERKKNGFVNLNEIFTAFKLSGAAIHVLKKWHGLCVHFLVGGRNGTGEMLQPLPST